MSNIIDTLHPKGSLTDNLYPNILSDNIPDAAINTAKIADGSITSAKIGNYEVKSTNLDDDSVSTAKLIDQSVTNTKLSDNSISSGKIRSNAVTTAKIADANVTTAKIADGNVTMDKLETSIQNKLKEYSLRFDGTMNMQVSGVPYSQHIAFEMIIKKYLDFTYTRPMTFEQADSLTTIFADGKFNVYVNRTNTSGIADAVAIEYNSVDEWPEVRLKDGSIAELMSFVGDLNIKEL